MKLAPEAEEVATFYSKMLEHDYVKQDVFNKNFFRDWRKVNQQIICHKMNIMYVCLAYLIFMLFRL